MDNQNFTEGLEKMVVLIYFDETSQFIGHGVLMSDDGLILTVCHLFFEMWRESIRFVKKVNDEVIVKVSRVNDNGKYSENYHARITMLDSSRDVAALQIVRSVNGESNNFHFDYAQVSSRVTVGQTAYMVVSSDGNNWEHSKGTVAFERRLHGEIANRDQSNYYHRNAPLVEVVNLHGIPGCSGAPIFDSQGHIVGVYSVGYGRRDFLVPFTLLEAVRGQAQPKDKNDEKQPKDKNDEKQSRKRRKRKRRSRGTEGDA